MRNLAEELAKEQILEQKLIRMEYNDPSRESLDAELQ